MSSVSSWLLSIVGIIIIGSLIEIILPNSNLSKYIKSIFAFIVIFVIISPIISLIKDDISLDANYDNYINNDFISSLNEDKINFLEKNIEMLCNAYGLKNVEVQIMSNQVENELILDTVQVFLYDLVIDENIEHIDKYQVLEDIIKANLKIEKEKIVFYE